MTNFALGATINVRRKLFRKFRSEPGQRPGTAEIFQRELHIWGEVIPKLTINSSKTNHETIPRQTAHPAGAGGLLSTSFAQNTAFTYQGRWQDQAGDTLTNLDTSVTNGMFTVTLDFGAQFPGADRWLAIGVRTNGDTGAFTGLTPRHLVTAAPYAVQALNAITANVAGNASSVATGITNGVLLTSDRNAKEDFAPVSAQTALAKVTAAPITEWNYKTDAAGQKHIGPMAQDFHAAFGLNGIDDKRISNVDEGGMALATIQGLNEKLEQKQAEITELKARLDKLEQLINTKTESVK
jgi:hypothetical protein